ncbi:MAG: hypothetical protein COZ16_02745 [Flavobacteriaceae bacterium CG_4_10_14_3_um_filter_31_253]|nr:MAG: hypothetical protein COZ16_02745 [Flavobacteriaceae bacterium CG_4_10_14_3_um_filter_31_253]
MLLFENTIVTAHQLSIFLNCHEKTARKYYRIILKHVGKSSKAFLVLEDLSDYYEIPLKHFKEFKTHK